MKFKPLVHRLVVLDVGSVLYVMCENDGAVLLFICGVGGEVGVVVCGACCGVGGEVSVVVVLW